MHELTHFWHIARRGGWFSVVFVLIGVLLTFPIPHQKITTNPYAVHTTYSTILGKGPVEAAEELMSGLILAIVIAIAAGWLIGWFLVRRGVLTDEQLGKEGE